MTTRKVPFGTNPRASQVAPPTMPDAADRWVASRSTDEPLKRLSLDLPAGLHGRIKASCALRGVKMVDEIRTLLEEKYPSEGRA